MTLEALGIVIALIWLSGMTGYLISASGHVPPPSINPKKGPSGPTIIANFMRDKFGNIVKGKKRSPIKRDDEAAYLAEKDDR